MIAEERITLKEGEMTTEGRMITVMGRTTNSFPAHCHFPSEFRSKE